MTLSLGLGAIAFARIDLKRLPGEPLYRRSAFGRTRCLHLRFHAPGEEVTKSEETDDEAKVERTARRPNADMDRQTKASRDRSVLFEPGNAGRCER